MIPVTTNFTATSVTFTVTGEGLEEMREKALSTLTRFDDPSCYDLELIVSPSHVRVGADDAGVVSWQAEVIARLAGLKRATLWDYAWVARQFESSIRIEDLAFKHHQIVAARPPGERRSQSVKHTNETEQLQVTDKNLDHYERLYRNEVPSMIDELVRAVRFGDEDRVAEIAGFGGELHASIGDLLVAAAARGRTMTDDDAALVFSPLEMN